MSLFDFGKYQLIRFVNEWLSLDEMISLDSALCEKVLRSTFLNCIGDSIVHSLGHRSDLRFPETFFSWLIGKNLTTVSTVGGHLHLYIKISELCPSFFSTLVSLTVSNCSKAHLYHEFSAIIGRCDGLKSLFLSGDEISLNEIPSSMEMLCSPIFSQLTRFSFTDYPDFTFAPSRCMIGACVAIANLNLSGCSLLSDEIVGIIVHNNNSNLRVIRMAGCDKLTDSTLVNIAKHCPNVELLAVSAVNMSDFGVETLVSKCKDIRTLELCGNQNRQITNKSLEYIGMNCPDLKSLNVGHNGSLSANGLSHILDNKCNLLTDLDVYGIFTAVHSSIISIAAKKLSLLAHLKRFRCGPMCTTVNLLAALLIPKFREITKLSFKDFLIEGVRNSVGVEDFFIDGSKYRADLLRSIIPLCRNLHTLDYETNQRDEIVNKFYPHCLKNLHVFKSSSLTENSELWALAKYTSLLEDIDLSGCHYITSEYVSKVFEVNPHLIKVVLSNCVSLDDECIVFLAKFCRILEVLHVLNCYRMTDIAVQALGEHSRCLVELDVRNTRVTTVATKELFVRCLGLRKLLCDLC